ncbi:MAG: PhzF family phenazine biosynthesis protein [Acidimicrobiia bacterium]|jgi:PhzF family phenazine biosynthesis protein
MLPLFVVDAFTNEPFRGNPAAVCVLPDGTAPGDAWMLAVAAEMKHSETAFVRRRAADGDWDLRWFTPAVEVDLCGHATLASAHVLTTEGFADPGAPLRFHTRSGVLPARPAGDGRIELDFPALASEPTDAAALRAAVADALGAEPIAIARNVHDLLAELADAASVRDLAPDFAAIAAIDTRAVVVTAVSDDPAFDFVSRCFGPRVGIDEDPVTGSAHCALAPYWAPRVGRAELVGRQVSARGGTVHCTLVTDTGDDDRVLLGGTAVTVTRGALLG